FLYCAALSHNAQTFKLVYELVKTENLMTICLKNVLFCQAVITNQDLSILLFVLNNIPDDCDESIIYLWIYMSVLYNKTIVINHFTSQKFISNIKDYYNIFYLPRWFINDHPFEIACASIDSLNVVCALKNYVSDAIHRNGFRRAVININIIAIKILTKPEYIDILYYLYHPIKNTNIINAALSMTSNNINNEKMTNRLTILLKEENFEAVELYLKHGAKPSNMLSLISILCGHNRQTYTMLYKMLYLRQYTGVNIDDTHDIIKKMINETEDNKLINTLLKDYYALSPKPLIDALTEKVNKTLCKNCGHYSN
ncbi:MAG: hypothetical protein ACYCPT_12225, partial [Acidimicrobiales bacterium]